MSVIYTHAFFALSAIPIGMYIFFTKKGTKQHRFIGRIWVSLMLIISFSALLITTPMTDKLFNPRFYSWIHLLIPFTVGNLIYSIYSIRQFKKSKLKKHKNAHIRSMVGVYIGALVVAGAFTLAPGRLMHQIVFE